MLTQEHVEFSNIRLCKIFHSQIKCELQHHFALTGEQKAAQSGTGARQNTALTFKNSLLARGGFTLRSLLCSHTAPLAY